MKLLMSLTILMTLAACSSNKENVKKQSDKLTKISTGQSEAYELKKGDQVYFEAHVHGSVGQNYEVSSLNEDVLKFVDTDFEYDNKKKADMPGGDGGTKKYIFEALKIGNAEIVVKDVFRGEVQKTDTIAISVL